MTDRLFVALELPPPLQQRLAGLPRELPGLRRLATDQLHVTLYFIGDRAPAADVRAALAEVQAPPVMFGLRSHPGQTLALKGTGRWTGVLWAGVKLDPALSDLQQRVTQALAGCGLEPDLRPFRPHVTLGRFPARRPPAGLDTWLRTQRNLRAPPAQLREFCLYSSELAPTGANYRILQRFPLRAEADA